MLSQPQLIPLSATCLRGFITLSDHSEYFLSVDFASKEKPRVKLDDKLQAKLDQYPGKLDSIIKQSSSPSLFVENLVKFLEEGLVPPTDKETLLILMKQVANLPAESIKSVDNDFKQVTLQAIDRNGRIHFVGIQLHSVTPTFVCDLPVHLTLPSNDSLSCQDVLTEFERVIDQYQALWDVLDDIDTNSWVIEPEPFSRGALHRRIVIKEDVSIIVTLDPTQPTSLPRCRFLGSARAIHPLQNSLDERGEELWDPGQGFLENITDVLQVEIPARPNSESQKMNIECGVCYCYEMMDQIPEISCNNESCRQLYHAGCLVEWFKGLPHVRQSFGTVFGECPYCSKPMHVQAVL